jgi:hypothetical protein
MGSFIEERGITPLNHDDLKTRKRENDVFKLDDETGRLSLIVDYSVMKDLPSGAVVGMIGTIEVCREDSHRHDTAIMHVTRVILPEPPVSPERMIVQTCPGTRRLAFVSGLRLGGQWSHATLGALSRALTDHCMSRLILAGTTILGDGADEQLASLCELLPVELIPGEGDPVSKLLPQQPVSKGLIPNSNAMESLSLHTNPCELRVGDSTILGSSGQPLNDMVHLFGEETTRLQALTLQHRLGHMAPTAPDTLHSIPMVRGDPYLIPHGVDLFFACGQPYADSCLLESPSGRVRILLVPDLAIQPLLVTVDLDTLEYRLVSLAT